MMAKVFEDIGIICRKNRFGFGWEIIRADFVEKEMDGEKYMSPQNQRRIFHTADKKQFDSFMEAFGRLGNMTTLGLEKATPDTNFEPMNLVLEQKHGSFCYLVKSEEGYMKAALKIVKERHKEGWYTDGITYYENRLKSIGNLTATEIAALPEDLQREANKQALEGERLKRDLEKERKRLDLIEKALKGDGMAAIQALQDFSDDKHDRVRLEKFQGIY